MDFRLTPEQKAIKQSAAEFTEGEFTQELAEACELSHRFPRELYRKAGELGFLGLDYPQEIGIEKIRSSASRFR